MSSRIPQYLPQQPLQGTSSVGGRLVGGVMGSLSGAALGALGGYLAANWSGRGSKTSKYVKRGALGSAALWGGAGIYEGSASFIPIWVVPIVYSVPLGLLVAGTAIVKKK